MSFPESLRDRAEAVMDDVGVVFSGDLVCDVTAAADALGVSYTTMDETVEACEEALFEKARRWVQEGLKKQREERIRKREETLPDMMADRGFTGMMHFFSYKSR